jgi:hypothetical protein
LVTFSITFFTLLCSLFYPKLLSRVVSLILAHRGDREKIAQTLAGLAPYLPQDLLREARSEALAIRNEMAKAQALTGLVPRLAKLGRPEKVFSLVNMVADGNGQAVVLISMAPHLPTALQSKALAIACEIKGEDARARALAGMAPCLPLGRLEQVLSTLQGLRWVEFLTQAITRLAPTLTGGLLGKALAKAQMIEDDKARTRALKGIAPYLPTVWSKKVLRSLPAIRTSYAVKDRDGLQSTQQTTGAHPRSYPFVSARSSHFTPQDKSNRPLVSENWKALSDEMLIAVRRIDDIDNRIQTLDNLVPRLLNLSCSELADFWLREQDGVDLLHALAHRLRPDLLADLRALAPIIVKLGGEEAIAEIFRAIQDVGRWWP